MIVDIAHLRLFLTFFAGYAFSETCHHGFCRCDDPYIDPYFADYRSGKQKGLTSKYLIFQCIPSTARDIQCKQVNAMLTDALACLVLTIPTPQAVKRLANSSPPGYNGCHFADDIFRCIFVNEIFCILIKISLKFVPKGPIDNNPAVVSIMAWSQTGDKRLSEPKKKKKKFERDWIYRLRTLLPHGLNALD